MYSMAQPGSEIDQTVKAHSVVRRLARQRVRDQLDHDSLHGAAMTTTERELGQGDAELQCILRGNRVRRFKDFDPMPAPEPVDQKAEMIRATEVLGRTAPGGKGPAKATRMMSDLSIDEELVLHSIGWEPIELVSGVSIHSVPMYVWNWGQGEIEYASAAYARSFARATERIHAECTKAG